MFAKTSNRWLIAVVTISVLAFAVPQTVAAAPFEAEPAGTSLGQLSQLVQWAAALWSGLGSVFDASTTTTTGTGGGTSQPGSGTGTNSGEQGGMIDPNG